jgi:hypothetical protein
MSSLPEETSLRPTNVSVQSAKAGSMLSPVGRADIGSVFKNSLIFEDGELAKDLVSIPKLDEDGCKIIIEKGKMKIYKKR